MDKDELKPLPMLTAAASWVDKFNSPMREIKEKYTKSDLTILAWQSKLQTYNMTKGMKSTNKVSVSSDQDEETVAPAGIKETEEAYVLPAGVNNGVPIKKKFFDKDGEIDLRQVTGEEAAAYIRGVGIPLAIVPRGRK